MKPRSRQAKARPIKKAATSEISVEAAESERMVGKRIEEGIRTSETVGQEKRGGRE